MSKGELTEKLLNNEYLNLNILKKSREEKIEFLKKMLKTIIDQTRAGFEIIDQAIESKDWEGVRAEIHHLKPSFAYIGADTLYQTITEVGQLAKSVSSEDKLKISQTFERVKALFKELLDDLKKEDLIIED